MRSLTTLAEGGGDPSLFYLTPLVPRERVLSNMRSAILRGLPEISLCRPHDTVMSVAGGGPSLADTYHLLDGWVCAINGSLKWLLDHDVHYRLPVACGVCDAGAHIADAVPAHPDVRYYVASVCDPGLFDKLVSAGCDVRLWHVTPESHECSKEITALLNEEYDDWHAIGGGCTMGLRWVNLGYYLGFRKFKLHGMDSSFRDGATHAYPDQADDKEHFTFAGRVTRPNFIAQVHDFAEMLEWLHGLDQGTQLEVFGDGLLQDEWKKFKEANPYAFNGVTCFDATVEALKRRLPPGPVLGAELGVFAGRFSRRLLQREDLRLLMVDSWEGDGAAYQVDSGDWHGRLTQDMQDEYKRAAEAATAFAEDRRRVIHMRTDAAAEYVGDDGLDFVYVDADHSYQGCAEDIRNWWPKVKSGGWLCGHDYGQGPAGDEQFPGVRQAVDDFVRANQLELERDTGLTWFVKKP